MTDLQYSVVFDSNLYKKEVEGYRIPALIRTKSGILVACCDARHFTASDYPNRVDKIVRRSTDDGKTWGEVIMMREEVGESKEHASSSNDPCLLYDEDSNRIHCLFTHTPATIGILNAKKGIGVTDKGEYIVYYKNDPKFVASGTKLRTLNNTNTDIDMNERGDIIIDGKYNCNIHIYDGEYRTLPTFYLTICHSDDEGLTWSKPVNLNGMVKKEHWSFLCAGPGVGIKLKNGANKGRLCFPIYYNTKKFPPLMLSCAVMYSDDNGLNWKIGATPNATRKRLFMAFKDSFVAENECLTESQLIELDDGTIRMFMRNHSLKKLVASADSLDGGENFCNFRFLKGVNQPICQMSVIRFTYKNCTYVALLNANSTKKRENGTIRLSIDDGVTFPYARKIVSGEFVYSSMAYLGDGKIAMLFENETSHTKIDFTTCSVEWIKGIENI